MGRLQNNPSIGWVHSKSTHQFHQLGAITMSQVRKSSNRQGKIGLVTRFGWLFLASLPWVPCERLLASSVSNGSLLGSEQVCEQVWFVVPSNSRSLVNGLLASIMRVTWQRVRLEIRIGRVNRFGYQVRLVIPFVQPVPWQNDCFRRAPLIAMSQVRNETRWGKVVC